MKIKITADRKEVLDATSRAIKYSQTKNPLIPIHSMARIHFNPLSSDGNYYADLKTFDGETYFFAKFRYAHNNEGSEPVFVNSLLFHRIVELCTEDEIKISFTTENDSMKMVIHNGRSKHKLHAITQQEAGYAFQYPETPLFSFKMAGSRLHLAKEGISNLIDEDAITMSGMNFAYVDDINSIMITGGTQTCLGYILIGTNKPNGWQDFVLPYRVAEGLKETFPGDESIVLTHYGRLLSIKSNAYEVLTTLKVEKYPNVYGVVKRLNSFSAVLQLKVGELKMALSRVMLHGSKENVVASANFDRSQVTLTMTDSAKGSMGVEDVRYLSADFVQPVLLGFNSVMLKKVLKDSQADTCTISTTNSKTPALVYMHDSDINYLIMPLVI